WRRAPFLGAYRWAIELAIAFQADQHAVSQLSTGTQHFWSPIPAICQHDHPSRSQVRLEQSELLDSYPDCRLFAADALDVQQWGPTAWLFGQQPHQRERPPDTDRFVGQRQVRDVDIATILAGFCLRALDRSGVHSDPDGRVGWQVSQHTAHAQRLQLF